MVTRPMATLQPYNLQKIQYEMPRQFQNLTVISLEKKQSIRTALINDSDLCKLSYCVFISARPLSLHHYFIPARLVQNVLSSTLTCKFYQKRLAEIECGPDCCLKPMPDNIAELRYTITK